MRAWILVAQLAAISTLMGCGIAAGRYHGRAPRNAGGPASATEPSPSTGPSAGPSTGPSATPSRRGFSVGLTPGFGHLALSSGPTSVAHTGAFVRIYAEAIHRLSSGNGLALEAGLGGSRFEKPLQLREDPGDDSMMYAAGDATLKYVYSPGMRAQFSIGAGAHLGRAGDTSTIGVRAAIGLSTKLATFGTRLLLLRIDGGVVRGTNDFNLTVLHGGFVLAF
jgi:hypothetical protein